MKHLSDFDNEELLAMYVQQIHEVNTASPDLSPEDEGFLKEEALHDLKSIKDEVLRRMTAAAETTPPAKPAYEEIVTGLERALEHLEYCGWGDAWEREVSVDLRKELPALLERAKIDVLDKVDCRDSLAFEEQAAVEFSCSSVPELTPGTLEYQINQLSLANAQLVSEIERIKSIQLGSINLRGKLEEWIELKGSWIGLAAEVKKILDSTDDQEFEEFVAVDSIVNAVSNIQASLKVLTNMEKGTKTRPPVYRCPKCKEPLSTCELRRAGTLDILEKEPSTTPPWCESCVVHER